MNERQVHIRPETNADVLAIEEVTAAAFRNAEHTDHNEQFIVRDLRAANHLSISLVAEDEVTHTIIGDAAVSPVTISDGSEDWYGLGPISVLPNYQGRGVGSLLMNRALEDLQARHAAGCVVLGNPKYYTDLVSRQSARCTFQECRRNISWLSLGVTQLRGLYFTTKLLR